MKQLNMVTLNQLPFPANHLAPGELRCENASHVDVATVERAAGFGLMGNLWEPPKSMGTTKFVIYYLCYTYNVVFCFDWVKGCRGDIPLENLDFGIIAPPFGTPWYIYIYNIYIYIYLDPARSHGRSKSSPGRQPRQWPPQRCGCRKWNGPDMTHGDFPKWGTSLYKSSIFVGFSLKKTIYGNLHLLNIYIYILLIATY